MPLRQRIIQGAVAIATRARNAAMRARAEITSRRFNPTRGVVGSSLRAVVAPALGGASGIFGRSTATARAASAGAPVVRSAVGRAATGVLATVKNAFRPTTLSALPKTIGANIIGASLPFIAYDVATSGSISEFGKKLGRQTKEIAALGINPLGALVGIGKDKTVDVIDWAKNFKPDAPVIDTRNDFAGFNLPEPNQTFNVSTGAPNIVFPESLGGSLGGGFSPSISVGGGPDLTPLLLALLGGGAAGYLLGRKKRKKYKRKKRKK